MGEGGWNERRIVDAGWLRARLGDPDLLVVDARPPERYAAGHIPGAVDSDVYALKLGDSSPEAVARYDRMLEAELRRIGVQAGRRVVFYEEITGTAAARGVWMLDYAGIGGGRLLDGGLDAWIAAGSPITREPTAPAASEVTIAPRPDLLATAGWIVDGLAAPSEQRPVVLDTRSDREYLTGTIPGAVHLEWVHHLRAGGRLRPPNEVRLLYDRAGLVPERAGEVVTFCASGYRAAHAYVILRALGFDRVRNYAASWHEWSQRPDLPIERPER